MKLPASVREIADVIGRERALYLIGKLPRYYSASNQNDRVALYVPQRLKPDHQLVAILGWQDAERLVAAFGGEILKPANCSYLYKPFRDDAIVRLVADGLPVKMVADWFGVCERLVKNLTREKPQVANEPANDNNPARRK